MSITKNDTPVSQSAEKRTPASTFSPIAIVGIGGLFPGSLDAGAFWQNILDGADLISDIPEGHWKVSDYYDANLKAPDKTYGKRGGFLPKVPFDTLGFGIPPNLLPSTDTSQLLGLMVARSTLEDAIRGDLNAADKSRVACILGVTSGQELFGQLASRLRQPEWAAGMRAAGIDEETIALAVEKIGETMVPWTEASFPGLLGNVVAGRIANRLDLGGMNAVTDAACASSFAAISMAIDELLLERSDLVLTGGVDTLNDIFMHMCFSKTPALSKSGDVRPFDANADGTLLGEGLGMIALRRLEDAERDGNKIYAVIRGIGSSSDGKSKSVYAPVSAGQANALKRSYEMAQVSPATIELIECHGTGTVAGDVAELGGLKLAFEQAQQERAGDSQWCAVGSVKSQIGHTKSAAGVGGLLKVALALHDKVLPPTIKVDTPNPKAEFETSPFYVSQSTRPWIRGPEHPRRAAVSSFGFGGSNFHITLEEYTGSKGAPIGRLKPRASLLVVDGDSRTVLANKLSNIADAAQKAIAAQAPGVATDRFAHERLCTQAQDALTGGAMRFALVATSLEQLAKAAKQAASLVVDEKAKLPAGAAFGEGRAPGKLAVLFPGQGSQKINMAADLAMAFAPARSAFDDADAHAFEGTRLSRVVFPVPAFSAEQKQAQETRLKATQWAQPALGAASVAAWRTLCSLGVQSDLFAGHSYGELVALHAAGVLDFDALMQLSRKRGELMATASDKAGAMAAVMTSPATLAPYLERIDGVVIANENAPEQTVVSGEEAAVDQLLAALKADGVRATKLPVSTAFHSPLVDGACGPMATFLDDIPFAPEKASVFANETAAPYPADAAGKKALVSAQIGKRVRFVDELLAMEQAGASVFVEVGPGAVLSGLAKRTLSTNATILSTDAKGVAGDVALLRCVGGLFALGFSLDFAALAADLPEAPKVRPPSKMAVHINGSNAGKPTPPKPAPARPRPVVERSPSTASTRAASTQGAPTHSAAPVQAAPSPVTPSAQTPTSSSLPFSVATAPRAGGAPMSQKPQPVAQGWLDVIRDGQRQTAEAHATFQKALSDAHVAFLNAYEQTTNAMTGTTAAIAPSVATAVSPPFEPAPTAPVVVATPRVASPVVAAPVVAAPVVAAPVVAAPVVSAPAAVVAAVPAAVDTTALLLEVVADKTGYPQDALDLSMALEADLGVDSIKRVEILGALRDRVPSLPDIDAVQAAQLVTLSDIANAVGTVAPAATAAAAPAASTGVDTTALLLEVVADKTGYPQDALDLSMALEADLGVDSIKRVEILGALRDRVPGLPDIDAVQAAQLVTLSDIATAVGTVAPASAAPAAPAAATGVDTTALLLEVVADKTGYPVDALDLSMALEADLGVDSIKRVEILGALRDRVPGLPDIDAVQAAQLVTLSDIANAVGTVAPTTAAPAASAASAASAAASGVDTTALLLEVVADKTGYPVDALDLSMALEADLGVDSIKRVEILGALRDRVPGLPDIDAVQAAQLVTLADIANAVGTTAPAASAPAAATGVDTTALLLEVVADKTGYPVDALDLSMALEADLGVDSIKRVEILGALRDRVPGLPDIDAVQAAQLVTLADIANAVGTTVPLANAPAASAPAASTGVDTTALLLEVVAEKTGYPVDALDLSMALEADLGVDSIKRVEILGALRDRVPGLPDIDAVQAAQLVTLADIANAVGSNGAPLAAVIPLSPAPAEQAEERTITRRAVHLERRPARPGAEPKLRARPLAIVADNHGVASALEAALGTRGVSAHTVAADLRGVDVTQFGGVVLLEGLTPGDGHTMAKDALAIVQKFAPVLREGGVLVCALDLDGTFGVGLADHAKHSVGALSGLVKTAALEWPKMAAKVIDVSTAELSTDTLGVTLAEEMDVGFGDIEVALADTRRVPVLVDVEPLIPSVNLNAGDLVVATGGARGVTAVSLKRLAELSQPALLLLGRTPLVDERQATIECADEPALRAALIRIATARNEKPNPAEIRREAAQILAGREIRANMAEMEALGSKVKYASVDVRDPASLGAALAAARETFGPVCGIVHGAGVLADKRIEDKTPEQLARVWATKVEGFEVLLDATAADPLKVICAFSSVAGRFGNAGQVDYSMANEAISKRSQVEATKRGDACVVKAIAWGPWDGGMVTPALKAHFEAQGIAVLPLAEGADHFVEALSERGPVEVVVGGPAAEEMRVEHHVSRKTYAFLADHSVQGTPVLPAVLAMEFVAGAAKRRRPDLVVLSVDDVQVRRGVRLEHFENGGDRLVVVLGPETQAGNALTMQAKVQPQGGGAPHYTATVVMGERLPGGQLAPLSSPAASPFADKSAIYSDMLFHGPAFHLLDDVSADDNKLVAQVTGLGAANWGEGAVQQGDWHVDAAALDAGLQMALLHARRSVGGAFLPTAVGRYVAYAPDFGTKELSCVATLTDSTRDRVTVDIQFVRGGETIFELKDVVAHRVPGDAGYATARAS